jgi:hypothetical protein
VTPGIVSSERIRENRREGHNKLVPTSSDSSGDQSQEQSEEGAEVERPTPESQLPAEAQGEANGGPLGCCLGVAIGLLASLTIVIISRLYSPLTELLGNNITLIVWIAMVIIVPTAAILCGYAGWKSGKRFYKEY